MTTVDVRVTEYAVCALPEDNINARHFTITVAYRGEGQWAVLRHGMCLGADGTWDYEPSPSNRGDEWLAAHRFDEKTAVKLAYEAAPAVTVNGHTVADVLLAAAIRERTTA